MESNSTLNQKYDNINSMLTEIEQQKNRLLLINENLLNASNHTCSEYGDRILENCQRKLFYFQHVLERSTTTLTKFKTKLQNAIDNKSKEVNFSEYFEFCQKTAKRLRISLDKYFEETERIVNKIC